MDTSIAPAAGVPPHVPPHLVYDYDLFVVPTQYEQPQWGVTQKLLAEAPDIFFTPRNGGHWVVWRADDIRDMYRQPDKFSSNPAFNYQKGANPTRHLPLYYDPPEHGEARKIFAPVFAPGAVAQMEPRIRSLAHDLIQAALAQRGCEFVGEIAQRFPVTIFLQLADAPVEDGPVMADAAGRYLRGSTPEGQQAGIRDLAAHLSGLLAQKRQAPPGPDLLSRIVNGEFLGARLTPEQQIGAAVFTFLAGLDTVAAMISFVMQFLAKNPGHYAWLREDPTRIPGALEELMRVSGVAMPERGATHDFAYKGIEVHKGDRFVFLNQISGMDPAQMPDPFEVDFARQISPHLVFGSGPHRCLGSHLARLEIRVFLDEFVRQVAGLSIRGGRTPGMHGGTVWIPTELPLDLVPAAARRG